MHAYIALFRGINVGGRHTLPMKDLKRILAGLGCADVATYIQSGNVVLRSERPAGELAVAISAEIERSHGFAPQVWLFEQAEFQAAVDRNPFDTSVGKALHVFFLDAEPDDVDWDRLAALKAESEEYALHGKVFYLYAPQGIGRSKIAEKLGQCIRTPMTARNWNTVSKLMAMVPSLRDAPKETP